MAFRSCRGKLGVLRVVGGHLEIEPLDCRCCLMRLRRYLGIEGVEYTIRLDFDAAEPVRLCMAMRDLAKIMTCIAAPWRRRKRYLFQEEE